MRIVRKLVYWLGFRPEPGNIFYSPSLALLSVSKEAMQEIDFNKPMWLVREGDEWVVRANVED